MTRRPQDQTQYGRFEVHLQFGVLSFRSGTCENACGASSRWRKLSLNIVLPAKQRSSNHPFLNIAASGKNHIFFGLFFFLLLLLLLLRSARARARALRLPPNSLLARACARARGPQLRCCCCGCWLLVVGCWFWCCCCCCCCCCRCCRVQLLQQTFR